MNLIFRLSNKNDLNSIMQIINYAQEYFKGKGIDQWQNGYPNVAVIERDIDAGESYVVCNAMGEVLATAMLSFAGEPTYKIIKGEWITEENAKYAVVHRIAVDPKYKGKGIATFILQKAIEISPQYNAKSIRIDTHKENKAMLSVVKRMNFKYCGIIYLEDGQERLAYEKTIAK